MGHDDSSDDHHRRTPTPRAVDMLSPEWQELVEHQRRISELERDRAAIFGHRGQPGVLAVMNQRMDAHAADLRALEAANDKDHSTFDGRFKPIEQMYWKVIGAASLSGTIVTVIVLLVSKLWR